MFGKFYVLSDAAPCCFSEATLSSRIMGLPNVAENSPILLSQTITPEANVREAPNLERPLPVWYVFRASASDYSWWSISDHLLYTVNLILILLLNWMKSLFQTSICTLLLCRLQQRRESSGSLAVGPAVKQVKCRVNVLYVSAGSSSESSLCNLSNGNVIICTTLHWGLPMSQTRLDQTLIHGLGLTNIKIHAWFRRWRD